MQPFSVIFDGERFDQVVHGRDGIPTLRDDGMPSVVVKDSGTDTGRAIAAIQFGVEVDGKLVRAQTVVPVRLLLQVLLMIAARYDDDGRPRNVGI
jgi:hypothetical protein